MSIYWGVTAPAPPRPSRSRTRWHQRPLRYSNDCASGCYATGRQLLLCGNRRTSEIAVLSELGTQVSTNCALCTGSVPPRTQDKLNNERLPQTQQVSCGLLLITSQSAQSTAFCKQTALRFGFSLASIDSVSVVNSLFVDRTATHGITGSHILSYRIRDRFSSPDISASPCCSNPASRPPKELGGIIDRLNVTVQWQ